MGNVQDIFDYRVRKYKENKEFMLKHMPVDNKPYKFRVTIDGKKSIKRFWRTETNNICIFFKGSSRCGTTASLDLYDSVSPVKVDNSPAKFRKRFIKAKNLLLASGLWQSFIPALDKVIAMTDEEFAEFVDYGLGKDGKNIWNEVHNGGKYTFLNALGSDLICSFFAKKMFVTPNWGWRKDIKGKVINSIANKEEFTERWTDGYDNSIFVFQQNNGELCASYSEEFRGCGNGHYYLLFDATHAIHYEDD